MKNVGMQKDSQSRALSKAGVAEAVADPEQPIRLLCTRNLTNTGKRDVCLLNSRLSANLSSFHM